MVAYLPIGDDAPNPADPADITADHIAAGINLGDAFAWIDDLSLSAVGRELAWRIPLGIVGLGVGFTLGTLIVEAGERLFRMIGG